MANNIKGITIEIGGDTTGLDKALKGVNSEIRTTQNELKEVEKSLKLDPGNIDLLEQKQRALNDAVDATTKKLDTLKTAQQQMADAGITDENRAQYDALTREIVNTEKALKDAEKAANDFNVEAAQMSSKLSEVSNKANAVAEATRGLSTAAGAVVAGIGAMALNSAAAADELNTMSKQSGLSTDELQRMQYASDLVDVSLNDMVSSQSKLRKSMSSNTEAFDKLGVKVKMSNGQMRDSNDVFYETLEALSRVGNETERDQLAMQIFGKNADQLAGIIDDGGAALKAYGDEAEQLGIILDEDTLESLNAVNDEIDKIKAQAKGDLAKAGATALEALTPVIEDIVGLLSGFLTAIGNMDKNTIEMFATVGAVLAAISPGAKIIGSITDALSGFLRIWPSISTAITAVTTFVASNPLLLIGAGIAALVALIITHWDEIKPVLEEMWDKIKEVVDSIREKVVDFVNKLKTAFNNIKTAVQNVFENVRDKIVGAFATIKDKVTSVWTTVRDTVTGVFTAIADNVKDKVNVVIDFVNSAIEKINTFIEAVNNSGVGRAIGLNIGQMGLIERLETSSSAGAALMQGGGGVPSTYNTYNNSSTYYQTSQQPLNVQLTMDGSVLAERLVTPYRAAEAAAGTSNMR